MMLSADNLEFEKASHLRDQIRAIEKFQSMFQVLEDIKTGILTIVVRAFEPKLATNLASAIIEELRLTSLDSINHRYPETDGLPEFRSAVSGWYKRRFNVDLDSDADSNTDMS